MKPRVIEDENGRRRATSACEKPCPIEDGMKILGGKWTGSILWHLQYGPVRFNDLSRMIAAASKKMITERLRHLEAQGVVTREIINSSPVSVEYSLTERGKTALLFLDELRKWTESIEPEVYGS
ncbi:helix-turn-helix transcriptional regulator [Parasedimentitalea maritima]|uniref:Helix-turn-helix transcriptional regulator n=1 Tax=Parasedimentitalea maritima TaxID=2578117 RepID=A0ABY2UWH5_9RHOB|nr:helix-turn-helix domain-containing protein [Zongyanglinia marina]TLP65859.1 helix-turn-helix transcriptional regulator [Zongyanglinia marina]